MMAPRDFQCDSCQTMTFRGEEYGYYDGWRLCIICYIVVEQAMHGI